MKIKYNTETDGEGLSIRVELEGHEHEMVTDLPWMEGEFCKGNGVSLDVDSPVGWEFAAALKPDGIAIQLLRLAYVAAQVETSKPIDYVESYVSDTRPAPFVPVLDYTDGPVMISVNPGAGSGTWMSNTTGDIWPKPPQEVIDAINRAIEDAKSDPMSGGFGTTGFGKLYSKPTPAEELAKFFDKKKVIQAAIVDEYPTLASVPDKPDE